MPYGAHEAMETNEILMEKINMITHFNLYARETNNPHLKDMIARHLDEEIQGYNEIVRYTHEYTGFSPIPANTEMNGVSPQSIQYGLRNPPQMAPQSNGTLSDTEIAIGMLCCHKNGARNATMASLECADPNLRQMLLNSSANCVRLAYEVFLFMNEQGLYQVPTLNDHTAKTFLHRYQPADQAGDANYLGQSGQTSGYADNADYAAQFGQQGASGGGQFMQQNAGYGGQFGQQGAGFGGQFGQPNAGYAGQFGQRGAGFAGQFGQQNRGYAGQFAQQGAGFAGQFGQQNRGYAGQFGQQGAGFAGQFGQQNSGMAGSARGMAGQSPYGTLSFPTGNTAASRSSQPYSGSSQTNTERSGSSAQNWTDDSPTSGSTDTNGSGSIPQ